MERNSGKDRIRNEGQTREGGIAYIYELGDSTADNEAEKSTTNLKYNKK